MLLRGLSTVVWPTPQSRGRPVWGVCTHQPSTEAGRVQREACRRGPPAPVQE